MSRLPFPVRAGASLCAAAVLLIPALAGSQARSSPPTTRAESLYVSASPADHPQRDHNADARAKQRSDSIYTARSAGVIDFRKVTYRSAAGDMDVPAYLFQPIEKRGQRGHAAMIWVHGGSGSWGPRCSPSSARPSSAGT
jgi:hypothetical protein